MQTIIKSTAAVDFNVQTRGSQPRAVFVHGFADDLHVWDDVWSALADELGDSFPALRYDLRGYGASVCRQHASFKHADDLLSILDAAAIDRCDLIGASMGGGIALNFTLDHPGRVRNLVLISPHLVGWEWSPPWLDLWKRIVERARSGALDDARRLFWEHPLFETTRSSAAAPALCESIMRYRKLGRSGLLVSELCLGTNMFGGANLEFWKDLGGLDQDAVNAVVARAVEGGVNFFDTADGYSEGQAEQRLGQALQDLRLDRSSVVICTKGGMSMAPGPNGGGASRAHLLHACDSSLQRLGVDYIDVYLLHVFDPLTPLEETLQAFDDLVRAGKVRYVGCSNFYACEVMKALGIAEREQLTRFQVVESNWSIATRDVERELLPLARSEGVGIMAWGALLGGVLSGKYRRDGSSDQPGRRAGRLPSNLDHNKVHDIVDAMRAIAQAHGVTPAEIALAFLLREPATSSVIFGSTKPEQVAANLRASGLVLADEEARQLEAVSAITPDYGSSVIARGRVGRQRLR